MNIFIFLEDEDLEDEDIKAITKGDLSPNLPKGEFGACPQIGKGERNVSEVRFLTGEI